jgi:hypothetical protein
MAKSRRNNRFKTRKNLSSKCRKNNSQHGGERKYVRAKFDFTRSSKDPNPVYSAFKIDDKILVTKEHDTFPKGINMRNCEKITYLPNFVEPYTPTDEDISSISVCELFDQKKKEAIDKCLTACGKQNDKYCHTHMSDIFTFENFKQEQTETLSRDLLSKCDNGRIILEPTIMREEHNGDADAPSIISSKLSPRSSSERLLLNRSPSSPSTPSLLRRRSSSASIRRRSSSASSRTPSRTPIMPPSTFPLFDKSIGFCGRKGKLGGRSNCVVLKSIDTEVKNKVVLYVNPANDIEVRFFKTDTIKYDNDALILKDDNYDVVIAQIKYKLSAPYVDPINSALYVINELYNFINEKKDRIYKGEVLLALFNRLKIRNK